MKFIIIFWPVILIQKLCHWYINKYYVFKDDYTLNAKWKTKEK